MQEPNYTGQLLLVTPSLEFENAFRAMVEDFKAAGDAWFDNVAPMVQSNFAAYVDMLERYKNGVDLKPGRVPSSTFWLLRKCDRALMGVGSLRHILSPALTQESGHIGYAICPSVRGQGYGTRMLGLLLEKAKSRGLQRVLVTCDIDNVASSRVIISNGGVLANEGISPNSGKAIARYWVQN